MTRILEPFLKKRAHTNLLKRRRTPKRAAQKTFVGGGACKNFASLTSNPRETKQWSIRNPFSAVLHHE